MGESNPLATLQAMAIDRRKSETKAALQVWMDACVAAIDGGGNVRVHEEPIVEHEDYEEEGTLKRRPLVKGIRMILEIRGSQPQELQCP